jgi:hypothetical protein
MVPLLILNVKAVTAPRKPSIREGRSFVVVLDRVYIGREENCCICTTRMIDKPMPAYLMYGAHTVKPVCETEIALFCGSFDWCYTHYVWFHIGTVKRQK